MSSFNGLDLFATGPHHFHVAGRSLRHQRHDAPGSRGASITPQGTTPRDILQSGRLIADDADQLRQLATAIESQLHGKPALLIDHLGRRWPGVVLLSFEPGPVLRLGPRLALHYRARYLQLAPDAL